MPKSSSLYIHIPFCKRLCGYCDFPKTMSLTHKPQTLRLMAEEISRRASELEGTVLKTIYFGGGTPTVCAPEELGELLDVARRNFDTSAVEEITVEANPDDLTADCLAALREVGVNRLSVGIQSFNDRDLVAMNRRHDAAGAIGAIERARKAGFDNISIDLIYGLAEASLQEWCENVERAVSLGVEHISAYHLTIEPNTLFGKRGVATADEELSAAEYAAMCRILAEAGYQHYEISNFALPTRRSRHNSAYWRGTPYLGVGPGAHSYDGKRTRRWNPSVLKYYLEGREGECETLSNRELYEEYVMVRLRTCEGVSLSELESRFGGERKAQFLARAERFVASGVLVRRGDGVAFEEGAWLISDGVIEEFFD